MSAPGTLLTRLQQVTRTRPLVARVGELTQVAGQVLQARGPDVVLGELCQVHRPRGAAPVLAEVVGLRPGVVSLMPYGSTDGLAAGCTVEAIGESASIGVGEALLGRVVDAFGGALDGHPDPVCPQRQPLRAAPINPMRRPPVTQVLETGVRCIDALLTLGRGQRMGIFAGSGVGKSTLLGMVARHVRADVNVIALIGERGREVRDFIDRHLGAEGLRRSVVVVATADQPALTRLRAALAAVAMAEHFRAQGLQVLLTMDSVTRYAMARREVGLAAGEPPTARGYTPSVFTDVPQLCERCGTDQRGGSITALLTVLVEGDDVNEPISDMLRATLDGHIVLSRELAHRGHYPAIDVLQSTSRLFTELASPAEAGVAATARRVLALLERNRQMVEIGAYAPGTHAALDRALGAEPALAAVLRQADGGEPRTRAAELLAQAVAEAA